MRNKEIIFIVFAVAFCIAFPFAWIRSIVFFDLFFWLAIASILLSILMIVFSAILKTRFWLTIIFSAQWLFVDWFLYQKVSLFFLGIGLPMFVLFFSTRREFASRVKISFTKSLILSFFKTLVLSGFILAIYFNFHFNEKSFFDWFNDSTNKIIFLSDQDNLDKQIEAEAKKSAQEITDRTIDIFVKECKKNIVCERNVRKKENFISSAMSDYIYQEISNYFNQASREKKVTLVNELMSKTTGQKVPLSVFISGLIFIVFVILALPISMLLSYLFGIIFVIFRVSAIFEIDFKDCKKEIIV